MRFQNGFYFGYGKLGFGNRRKLGKPLTANFTDYEGAGIAVVKGVDTDRFPKACVTTVENLLDTPIVIRLEKKDNGNIIEEKEIAIEPKQTINIEVFFTSYERKHINEFVVCMRRPENEKVDAGSIKVNIK